MKRNAIIGLVLLVGGLLASVGMVVLGLQRMDDADRTGAGAPTYVAYLLGASILVTLVGVVMSLTALTAERGRASVDRA